MRETAIHGTLSAALAIGRALGSGGGAVSPVDHLVDVLRDIPTYGHARALFDGKIVDVDRRTARGFSVGSCRLDAIGSGSQAVITFQNENLSCDIDGEIVAVTPDLICIVDRETAEPIPTPQLKYGQRVRVVGIRAPDRMRTPQALAAFGPTAFGIDAAYTPLTCA